MLDSLYRRDISSALARSRAAYVMLPFWGDPEGPGSLRDRLGILPPAPVGLTLLHTYTYTNPRWWNQFQFTGNAFNQLRLYAVQADS